MIYQKRLVEFVKLKNEIIERDTGFKYVTRKDIEEIENWTDCTCRTLYNKIFKTVQENTRGLTSSTCVWCFQYDTLCFKCTYADRHGKCGSNYSLFDNYRHASRLFSNEVYKNMFKKIESQIK